jgi:anti-sigma regulatory factor (Ser/Thr protein kinase)
MQYHPPTQRDRNVENSPLRLTSTRDLAATPAAITSARRYTAAVLSVWYVPSDVIETSTLLVSELATNALRHGQLRDDDAERLRLRLHRRSRGVRIEVLDRNPSPPERRWADDGSEDGRGLLLVQALSSQWGFYRAWAYKVVWCEVRCPLLPAIPDAPLLEAKP